MKNLKELNTLPLLGSQGVFTGKILLASPFISESWLNKSVIYVCGHSDKGAIGFIINKELIDFTMEYFLTQVGLSESYEKSPNFILHYGGPINTLKGFVIHSHDYQLTSSIIINREVFITSNINILNSILKKKGPSYFLLCLGYIGWEAGQLENEIQNNQWIIMESNSVLFSSPLKLKWSKGIKKMGIVNPLFFSPRSGNA